MVIKPLSHIYAWSEYDSNETTMHQMHVLMNMKGKEANYFHIYNTISKSNK